MTKEQAFAEFKELYTVTDCEFCRLHPEHVFRQLVSDDVVLMCEEWNNFTDTLCKEGKITRHQYETWCLPF